MKLNIIRERKELVRFSTFGPYNQGIVYHLADKEVSVLTIRNTRTSNANCTSQELTEEEMDVVQVDDRVFLINRRSDPWQTPRLAEVYLPYGFRPDLLFPRACPYCGK